MLDWPRPLVFAHRGASLHAPENTLEAFKLALDQGAPALELDTKLSQDGEVVVIHDSTVDRTTDGRGRVSSMPVAALRDLDAGFFFSKEYRGQRIPCLSEVFELIGNKAIINVELTNYATPGDDLVDRVCDLVTRFGLESSVLFSSFLPSNLTRARKLLPAVPCGLLALSGLLGWWPRSFGFTFGNYQALHPHLRDITAQQVARVHRIQRRVHVYTVNAIEDMRRLFGWKVDGIFTDDPKLALDIISEFP